MSHLSSRKQVSLLSLAIALWAFLVYVRFFATHEAILFTVAWNIDKLAHLGGGVFLALLVEWRFRQPALRYFILLLASVAVGWEILEVFFDPETQFFYSTTPDLWRLDSFGDITAAFLGGYGYWVFGMDRGRAPRRELARNNQKVSENWRLHR